MVQAIAQLTGAHFGVIGEASNSVGCYLATALPVVGSSGLDGIRYLHFGSPWVQGAKDI